MVRFTTALAAVAAAAAFATPLSAQTESDPSTMTCADYMALQEGERPGFLQQLLGASGGGEATENAESQSMEASAEVSSDDIVSACEGNDEMMMTEAVAQARSN